MTNVRPLDDPPPGAESGSTSPGLAVAAVARRLGVAPATLRTWDRRYGLGPSEHSAGAHRRYSDDDVARLMVMRRLALDGVAPVDAARSALALDLSSTTRERVEAQLRDSLAHADSEAVAHDASDPLDGQPARPGHDEDSVASLGSVAPLRSARDMRTEATATTARPALRLAAPVSNPEITSSDIVDAVLRGNLATCVRLLGLDMDQDPAEWWTTLVEPTVRRLSARTVLAKPGEAPEVLLASATLTVLGEFIRKREERTATESGGSSSHPSRMRKIVLLFSAVDDPQPLAMHALGAALVAQGVTARVVTGPANAHRAMELVTMVRPVATVLVTSLTRPELGIVHALHDAQPDLPIFVGLSSDDAAADLPLSANVSRVRSFQGLLHEVLAIAR